MGAYLLITLTFSCQHDQLVGVYSDRLKNRGLRHGSGQKRGVLGTGQARKKGGLRHGSGQKRGVFTAAHTCTGHICECPPRELASERASSDMCLVGQEARAQTEEHDRRLSNFLQKFDDIDALRASTPRRCPTFGYQPSPVVREEVSQPPSSLPHFESARTEEDQDDQRNSLPHARSARTGEQSLFRDTRTRDHDDNRDTRTRDHDDDRDTRTRDHDDDRDTRTQKSDNTLPHAHSARTGEHLLFRDTRTREHDGRDSRTLQFRLDNNRNSTDNHDDSTFSRPSSCPKVPTFDGSNTAQFRPWIIQFEAIARHQGWSAGERVVRLVSSLTGPAANLLIGMTLEQLDDYNCLRRRLARRYDPPEREEAHRAELRARTRRRNESADGHYKII